MRTIQYVRAGCLIGTLGACMLMSSLAQADVTTERPGSLLIFPKVVQAGGRETIIQITNTGNNVNNLHCYYLDGRDDANGHPVCAVTDFFISLTKQQPTHWDASTGRGIDPTDSITGLDPGLIPPVPPGFTGALVCAEVDDGGIPTAQNKIKGEATLEGPAGDIAKYSALAVQGNANPGANNGDNVLSLGGGAPEYNGCPTASIFNFIPEGSTDPVVEALGVGGTCSAGSARAGLGCNNDVDCPGGTCTVGQSRILNTLTAIPCNLDFQTQVPTKFTLAFDVYDQDESMHSGSHSYSCWASIDLADFVQATLLPAPGELRGPYATMRIKSAAGGPVLLVGETLHVDAENRVAAAAVNLHTTGLCQAPGAGAAPQLEQTCQTNSDCPTAGSTCILTQPSTIKLPTLAQ